MGIDLYGVIEVDRGGTSFLHPDGFMYVNWPRHRELYSALLEYGVPTAVPKRGFPSPCSYLTQVSYGWEVVPDTHFVRRDWGTVRETNAKEHLKNRESHVIESSSSSVWISDPANSYANWLTRSELLSACTGVESTLSAECTATLAALGCLEAEGLACRFVFWFDC
jgi:hypothetical protein